ncbi:MAG: ATP-binding protein [Nostoc sp. NMS1]|uniref:tetratricopeptide repeat protein n=1 Tax=unclassified Nostoc TaxID=2593658 RepID=UPI0025D7C46A|nr:MULTISPECIES: AAA family ATPase [unclassified Nostoc]MBN3905714.1 ATP-binding protein [Nostoc sp. NMS1]MBN3994892.1 ATP-binding protein [Nostoc sp. NMS2]
MSEIDKLEFVGREEHLNRIITLIQEVNTLHVVLVEGRGGIGKTWLLNELQNRLNQVKIGTSEIIDCDTPVFNDAEDLCTQIAKQLYDTTYQEWLLRLRQLREDENRLSQTSYQEERKQLEKFLVDEINRKSKQQRLVFLIDTVEKLGQAEVRAEVWEYIGNLCQQLDNAVFILAGRPSIARQILEKTFKEEELTYFELNEFTHEDVQTYILSKEEQLHFTLGKDLVQKIIVLSGGSPIMIEFGVEYAYREVIPDWLESEDIETIPSRLEETGGFEAEMVRHITQLRTSMDRLTLLLSRIYPLDSDDIANLLELSTEDAQRLFIDAQSYFFIKPVIGGSQIALHDIVRDLVNKYVWADIDPDKEWRKRDSRIAAKYFEQKDYDLGPQKRKLEVQRYSDDCHQVANIEFLIEEIKQLREFNTIRWLENALYADPIKGFETWREVTDRIRRQAKKFSFVKQLVAIAKGFEKDLNPDQKSELIIFDSKIAHDIQDKGRTEDEVRKLEVMLSKQSSNSYNQADIYNVLGMLNTKLHLYDEALKYQQKCLSLVQGKKLSSAIPGVANQVGYLYRQLNNFKEAEKYYKLGWDAAMEVDTPNKGLTQVMASIQNNLGFLYGREKDYIKAEQCFKAAIDMWSSVDSEREIAHAEIASATISIDNGNYIKAKQLLERALSRCDNEENDNRILCRAYFQLGLNQWFSAEVVNEAVWDVTQVEWDLNLLSQAQDALKKSLKLAEKYGIEEELPGILHQTASVYWHLGFQKCDRTLQEQALKLNDRSYHTSLEYNDRRYAIDSLVGKAEFDYYAKAYQHISDYARELSDRFQSYQDTYQLYFGRILRIEGDVAFQQENYDLAFAKYAQGIPQIFQDGGFGPYSIQHELNLLQKKIERLPIELSKTLIQQLKHHWQDNKALKEWCDQQMFLTRIRATKQPSSHA